jgi:hypothetical protein
MNNLIAFVYIFKCFGPISAFPLVPCFVYAVTVSVFTERVGNVAYSGNPLPIWLSDACIVLIMLEALNKFLYLWNFEFKMFPNIRTKFQFTRRPFMLFSGQNSMIKICSDTKHLQQTDYQFCIRDAHVFVAFIEIVTV